QGQVGQIGSDDTRDTSNQAFGFSTIQLATKLLLGSALIVGTATAQEIAIDPNQAGSKPIIGVAANGVPVVNVVAPNAQGVSLNQFQNYNVNANGLVLNNSGAMSQTQLAGFIQGNPMLGNNAARTIINQVTGPNGSSLNGYQEIAGNRSNLIVANPNGISVNGAGFINAANVTLTTGTPQFNNGALTGFNVTGGNITVNGQGLNATGADKLSLITRAAQLNAQVWANQADLILGANQVTVDGNTNTAGINAQTGQGTAPQFALDVAALGGMYAGQMRLVGTEAGLGINNGGKLISEGNLTLDAQGNLTNAGRIESGNDSSISVKDLTNSGQITTVNNQVINAQAANNSGNLTAGSVQLNATSLNNTGNITQSGAQSFDIAASSLVNTGRIGIVDQTASGGGS
ncbi:filamentous hemagglutinin N-terminal domain-containing protein, partial [Formosimonas limnophila]|uniref:filamentous hemagglutinin N-terminal domain-containing protein n=1 Tax=Formosimonas limnophila TaxID=1384487 RepID=UPI001679478B